MELFNDGILRAEVLQKNWLFLTWENNQIGKLPIRLVKDLKAMERIIKANDMIGWVCNSEKSHTKFHDILKRVGAVVYDEDDEFLFFKREIKNVQQN